MKQILVLSAQASEAERIAHLSSRMNGAVFTLLSPAGLRGFMKKARFKRKLQKAASRADLILVSPAALAEQARSLGKPVLPMPYGVDFEAFHGVAERLSPFPDDLFNIQNPIIGHTGPVDGSCNLLPVAAAAEAHPEWAFVFAGPVRADVSAWKAFPNIHLLGDKPPAHLPAYVSRFDVCINIAKSGDASPENLYQYLSAGKTVVSSPHPAQVLDYTDAVYLAGTGEEFIDLCKKAIGERDGWKARRRVEYGRAAGWDARAAELERFMKELTQ